MGESVTEPAEPPAPPVRGAASEDGDLVEVRRILVGPEQRQLREIAARLDDRPGRTRELSRLLPDAVALRANDPQLTRALAPSVEEAITASVRRNPRPLADALFPVMGPAIRKAIAHTLSAMMESLNRTVDQSVSWRALRWRVTAWRTGKPFAEVVLLNTLAYRVEQVFLIHRESGLLVQHVSLPDAPAQDADMVSAMLTAIRDFVRDSFGAGSEESLEGFRVGETVVLVEQGPHAVLAAVVRGTPPPGLRTRLKEVLESVHLQRGEELQAFAGDSAPFESVRPLLQDNLETHFRPPDRPASRRGWAIAAALLLAVAAIWAGMRWRERSRFDAFVQALQGQPGVVVVDSGRRGGRFFVRGLRDPLATPPSEALEASGLAPEAVEQRWEPYSSHDPRLALERARAILRWPDSVAASLREGVLRLNGQADPAWIADAVRVAPLVPGVARVEVTPLIDESLQKLARDVGGVSLVFPKGSAELQPGQSQAIGQLRASLESLLTGARLVQARLMLQVVGHTDNDGSEQQNLPLSSARAEAVRDVLGPAVLGGMEVLTRGVGSDDPALPGASETEKARNRRVSFHVDVIERGASSPDYLFPEGRR